MKNTFLILVFFFLQFQSYAQDAPHLARKGKFMIENGYNLISVLSADSGLGIIAGNGQVVFSIGGDMGYFLSDNFALKGRLGLILGDGTAVTSFGTGVKYYLAKRIPIEVALGVLASGDAIFQGGLTAGYSARLADNILLEPAIGINVLENVGFGIGRINFVLLF